MDDIFEKIIAREIPADIVYEDERVIAFLDINPINKGHTLVVPKKKFINIFDADSEILGHMMRVAQKVARALRTVTHANGVNVVMNNEAAAGQKVFHAHIHVIPRFTDDGAFKAVHLQTYAEGEIQGISESIKKELAN